MKAMREERWLCYVNVITVVLSAIASAITVFFFSNLNAAILVIPYLLSFRCFVLEIYIGQKLGLKLVKNALLEIGLATSFIIVSWSINSWWACISYIVFYILYILLTKEDVMALKKIS